MAPPLDGIRVVELAGLAPVPYAGLLLADFGASVLRIDRPHPDAHAGDAAPPKTPDSLTRNKASIALDLKRPASHALLLALLDRADVLVEPFRPGVLEKLGLAPATLQQRNPRLIVARLTGFRRDGPYSAMAGHDINYLAVSGILSQLGRAGMAPNPPANLLGDFAGGGLMCAFGIVLALLARARTGRGQVVHENMVDAVSSIGAFARLGQGGAPGWAGPRGTNLLDGGSPFYDTYETRDGRYVAVGALEPAFFDALVRGLGLDPAEIAPGRYDRDNWPAMRRVFAERFRAHDRAHWETVFAGSDACVTPILEHAEMRAAGYEHRAAVELTETPGVDVVGKDSWVSEGLGVGEGGEAVLRDWMGWRRDTHYRVEEGALVQAAGAKL